MKHDIYSMYGFAAACMNSQVLTVWRTIRESWATINKIDSSVPYVLVLAMVRAVLFTRHSIMTLKNVSGALKGYEKVVRVYLELVCLL